MKQEDLENDHSQYRRLSPLVIGSHFFQGLGSTLLGKSLAMLIGNTAIAFGVLQVMNDLGEELGIHWMWRVVAVGIGIVIGQLVRAIVKYFTFMYRVDADSISTKSGLFNREEKSSEWCNIRSIRLTQTPIQNRIGFAAVSLATAHSSDNAIEIPFISMPTARGWQVLVQERSGQDVDNRSTDLESIPDRESSHRLHKLTYRELLLSTFTSGPLFGGILTGFTKLGFVYCAVRFLIDSPTSDRDTGGLFSSFGKYLRWIVELPSTFQGDATRLMEFVQQISGIAISEIPNGYFLFYSGLILVLATVFYLFGLVTYFSQNFGYECTETGGNLHQHQGLINKSSLTIRQDRVQFCKYLIRLRERPFRRGSLSLIHGASDEHLFEIPFITKFSADEILKRVQEDSRDSLTFDPFKQSFTPIHIMSFFHAMIKTVAVFTILWVCLITFIPPLRGAIWPYLLIVFGYSLFSMFVGWRKEGYRIDRNHLIQRDGGIGWYSVSVAPIRKVQRVSVTQGWIQRFRDRANIEFHYVSEEQEIPYLRRADAEQMKSKVQQLIRGCEDDSIENEDHSTGQENSIEQDRGWKQLPKRYVVRKAIGRLLSSLIFLTPVFMGIAWLLHWSYSIEYQQLRLPLMTIFGMVVVWRVIKACVEVSRFGYAMRDDHITTKKAFLSKTTEVTRFSRLQAVSTNNNWLDRLFCVSDLSLYTVEATVVIAGLRDQEAFQLRESISSRLLEISNTGEDALSRTETKGNERELELSNAELRPITWKKFSGWRFELIGLIPSVLLGLPVMLLLAIFMLQPVLNWEVVPEFVQNFYDPKNWPFALVIYIVLSVHLILSPFIRIPRQGYDVSQTDLRYKEGWLQRNHEFIPIDRIQNVSVRSKFFERLCKVRSITIETPGFSTTWSYLGIEETEQLHSLLVSRNKQSTMDSDQFSA